MRWWLLLAVLVVSLSVQACSDSPRKHVIDDGAIDPSAVASIKPFTVNADPNPPKAAVVLRDVRVSAHPENGGWDRIVFEFQGGLPPGEIEYRTEARGCGSGERVALASTAVLVVGFSPAVAHDDAGHLTVRATNLQGPGSTILQARLTCDYEAEVTWALAIEGPQPFRVATLTNPPRVVIDVKQ